MAPIPKNKMTQLRTERPGSPRAPSKTTTLTTPTTRATLQRAAPLPAGDALAAAPRSDSSTPTGQPTVRQPLADALHQPTVTPRDRTAAESRATSYPRLTALLQRYEKPGVTQAMLFLAVAKVLTSHGRLSLDRLDLSADERHRLGVARQSLESASTTLKLTYTGWWNKKLFKRLNDDLVGLKRRSTDQFAWQGIEPFTQRFGHVAQRAHGGLTLVDDLTLSSEGIKKDGKADNAFMRAHNANLGGIVQNGKLLMVRSARSDTKDKLAELLLFGAVTALRTQPARGASAPPFEYQGAIVSAMDLNPFKSAGTRLQNRLPWMRGEDEAAMLKAQQRAVRELFGDKPCIDRTLETGEVIRLRRPVLIELPFSSSAAGFWGGHNIELSRAYNKPGAHALCDALVARLTPGHPLQAIPADPAAREEFFRTWNFVSAKGLSAPDAMAMDALKIIFTGKDSNQQSYRKAADPGRQLLLMRHLFDAAGCTMHAQCKSGQDRTLSMVSLVAASHAYDQLKTWPYDPRGLGVESDMPLLKALFTQAANSLGENPIKDVRGEKGKAKWQMRGPGDAAHPVPALFYNPQNSRIGQGGTRQREPGYWRRLVAQLW